MDRLIGDVADNLEIYMSSFFFFSSRRRHTRLQGDWSSDVCSSDLVTSTASLKVMVTLASVATSVASDRGAVSVTLGPTSVAAGTTFTEYDVEPKRLSASKTPQSPRRVLGFVPDGIVA